ncbi:hypothetical protein MMC08_005237 [Hypocenomyce scalaris]|nr:hypothetical protein [Hypocenomyce scalaris]
MTVDIQDIKTTISRPPWVTTPCVKSNSLSTSAGCDIFMKLEQFQPSGSFKSRGVGNLVWRTFQQRSAKSNHPKPKTHFISSSGGNAGLAATVAAKMLGQHATVIVPESTGEMMRNKIIAAGGNVVVHGQALPDADEYVRVLVSQDSNLAYVPPFDHKDIWEGNSTIIDELYLQLNGSPPDAIVCSVGGGGLLNGIMLGLERYGWSDLVAVLGMETKGADSLGESIRAGHIVTLPGITSIARSLGVTRVSDKTWEFAQQENVKSVVLSDAQAAMACVRLAAEEKIIVEPACGVSVAACYQEVLAAIVPNFNKNSKVVIIVCGGSNISVETLVEYQKQYSGRNQALIYNDCQ